jgi:cell wall-associated NlpC family hydrolase
LLGNRSIVTDVEMHSTARSGTRRKWLVSTPAALGGAFVMLLSTALLESPRVAAGDPLSNARAQAAQIAAQLQADATRVDQITQQYEADQARVQQLDAQIQKTRDAIASDQAQVSSDQVRLRRQAIAAYISSGDDGALSSIFASGGQNAVVAGQYRDVASGNISDSIDNLNLAEKNLAAQEQQLQATEAAAQTALDEVASEKQAAENAVASQEATLSEVKGQIASLVRQAQAAQQAAQHAAFVSRVNAAANVSNLPAAGGASTAVRAAESQIGVPYRWGGEQPGVGFDCSGLTQWSWGQAGVGIPRTAQDQYDAIAHVSLGDLQPGDLLFWGGGTGDISHVAMYVGGGDVVQAPYTGTDVQITPIWNNGLVGAGRP